MATVPAMAKSNFGRLADRYRDAYRVAAGTVRFGDLVKRGSPILAGAAFVLISLVGVVKSEYSDILGGLFFGVIILVVGYLSGMCWVMLGQFMRAMARHSCQPIAPSPRFGKSVHYDALTRAEKMRRYGK